MIADPAASAVERRMVADVPVGVLLSGGLDSSLIVGLLAEGSGQKDLKTFNIGFEEVGGRAGDEFDIRGHGRPPTSRTDHHRIEVSQRSGCCRRSTGRSQR